MDAYTIEAKPTVYRGIEMRSRHEAKWAAFFDAVGLVWEYEPDVNLGVWRPDFRLIIPCTGDSCAAEYHTILVEIKFWNIDDPKWKEHASNTFMWGSGIEEDGIGHLGADWQHAECYLRHKNNATSCGKLKNRLLPLCDSYINGSPDINKFCKDKWREAEEVVKQIRQTENTEQSIRAAPILQMNQLSEASAGYANDLNIFLDLDTDVEPLVAFSQYFLKYFDRDATFTTEDVLDVVRSTVLALDKDLQQHALPDARLRILDIMHMIEQRSTASLKGRRTVK